MIPQELFPTFRDALISGKYNLLLGAGVSLDSRNGFNNYLRSGDMLRMDLCKIAEVDEKTPLHSVYGVLSEEQIRSKIINKYSNCIPGNTVKHIPGYVWKKIFTFNIDDALENAYELDDLKKQEFKAISFDRLFEPETDKFITQIIHLHGCVRNRNNIVFSYHEYANIMAGRNPWMDNLAQSIMTEPFIISGSKLDEIDLEYYLSRRTAETPRRGSAASFYIDPHPDKIKESICKRHSLIFVKATLNDFFVWLKKELPSVPDVASLLIPDAKTIFPPTVSNRSLMKFFSDFRLIGQTELPLQASPSGFLYGNEPDWNDIFQHVDISRAESDKIVNFITQQLKNESTDSCNIITLFGDPGTGKTTTSMRVAHTIATLGVPVFEVYTSSKIDVAAAKECFSSLETRVLILLDAAADHIEQASEIALDPSTSNKVILLAVDRTYRKPHLDLTLGDTCCEEYTQTVMLENETKQLIERYAKYGLTATIAPTRNSTVLAKTLRSDPVAVAVCKILNDFKPLDRIIESIVHDSNFNDKIVFQHVALAQYCYAQGIKYSLLQSVVGQKMPISRLFKISSPLRLVYNVKNNDYVVAQNRTIAERILHSTARRSNKGILSIFCNIANGLAAHVNRFAIRNRTPEARLATRIFDVDTVVRQFLGDLTFDYFVATQDSWEWNSRYWEQRALYTLDSDPITALSYAKHAVSVERHQYPLTTLGKILILQMAKGKQDNTSIYSEAFDVLSEAIRMEIRLTRLAVHPYLVLFNGSVKFLGFGGSLTAKQWSELKEFVARARQSYRSDTALLDVIRRLEESSGF